MLLHPFTRMYANFYLCLPWSAFSIARCSAKGSCYRPVPPRPRVAVVSPLVPHPSFTLIFHQTCAIVTPTTVPNPTTYRQSSTPVSTQFRIAVEMRTHPPNPSLPSMANTTPLTLTPTPTPRPGTRITRPNGEPIRRHALAQKLLAFVSHSNAKDYETTGTLSRKFNSETA